MASEEQKQGPRRRGTKVIGAGLGRTGTKSLAAALDILGYKTYHFPLPQHSAAWAAYASGTGSVQDAINIAVVDGDTTPRATSPWRMYSKTRWECSPRPG